MKSTNFLSLLMMLAISSLFFPNISNAQETVPPQVASIVKMNLKDGQAKLSNLGYELCASSSLAKMQSWYNKSTKKCITVKFNKSNNQITDVTLNNDIPKCERGLAAMQKTWEMYHEGQSQASGTKLNLERKKLADKGFKASYWVKEPAPGRNIEYWINETTKKTMFIVWEIQGNNWVKTEKTDFNLGYNPAPKNK